MTAFLLWPLAVLELAPRIAAHTLRTLTREPAMTTPTLTARATTSVRERTGSLREIGRCW